MIVLDLATKTYHRPGWPGVGGAVPGTRFVDAHRIPFTLDRRVMLGDVRGGEPKTLYEAPAGHAVTDISASTDGKWLTWIDRSDESDIWLMTLDEGSEQGSTGGSTP